MRNKHCQLTENFVRTYVRVCMHRIVSLLTAENN